jgi:hypothetical protein
MPRLGKAVELFAPENQRLAKGMDYYEFFKDSRAYIVGKYRTWKSNQQFHILINSEDEFYSLVMRWVIDQVPPSKQKNVRVITQKESVETPGEIKSNRLSSLFNTNPEEYVSRLRIVSGESVEHNIDVSGYKIKVKFLPEGIDNVGQVNDSNAGSRRKPDEIHFIMTSHEAQKTVIDTLEDLLSQQKSHKRIPYIHIPDQYDEWNSREKISQRHLDSLKLPGTQMQDLIADLEGFMANEEFYLKRDLPYHRGYLFTGPPGCGKTSAVKAMAAHHNLDVYYLPLGDMNKDVKLIDFISSVRAKSILLIEDIDVYQVAMERETGEGAEVGLSLSGLLNSLDGVMTPHGLITILTSNHPNVLDSALIRPGRIDRVEQFGYVTDDTLNEIFEFFYEQKPRYRLISGEEQSPASVLEICKRNMFDPLTAEVEIERWRHTNGSDKIIPLGVVVSSSGSEDGFEPF